VGIALYPEQYQIVSTDVRMTSNVHPTRNAAQTSVDLLPAQTRVTFLTGRTSMKTVSFALDNSLQP
jgi:hypothetical protein